MSSMNATAYSNLSDVIGMASIHLVNLSTVTQEVVVAPGCFLEKPYHVLAYGPALLLVEVL